MIEIPATLSDALERFQAVLERDFKRLETMTSAQVETSREPGKWTPRQIIGHLIDSAANNHQRFVRGQLEQNPPFQGYAQNEWVDLQSYSSRDWSELLTLWHAYNRHLLHLVRTVKPETLEHVFQNQDFSLDVVMRDYVRHLEHHLAQIFFTPEF